MTTDERFGRTLSRWLREEAEHRVPGHLAEVLVQTAATRQRPWWSSPERWLPMTTTTLGGRLAAPAPLRLLVLLALLVASVAGVALLAGQRAPTLPAGAAENGRIVAIDGSTLVTFDADGGDRRELLTVTGIVQGLSVSPDGARVAYRVSLRPPTIEIVTIADGSTMSIELPGVSDVADEAISWSPDGRFLVFSGIAGRELLYVAAVDGSSVTSPGMDAIESDAQVWWPSFSPDGEWIAFVVQDRSTEFAQLHVMRPDGTDLRVLDTPSVATGDGGGAAWAPDPDVHRIAYLTFSESALQTRVFDLDTDTDHEVGPGFWPSWSRDGSRLATCCASIWPTDDILAGTPTAETVFAQSEGSCADNLELSGQAICSAVVWSPDGRWLVAQDVAGRDLLLIPADGSGSARRIEMPDGGPRATDYRIPVVWQPVWP